MKKVLSVLLFVAAAFTSYSQSTTVVISQVNGGGGGSTGTYLYDYVELHNVSSVPQVLTGWSLQYGSSTGQFGASATNIYAFPSGTTIAPGKFLLVQLGPVGTAGAAFPVTPDLITTNLTMSASSGKVVLSNQSAALGCGATATPCALPNSLIVDLVSYGASNNGEGGTTVNNGAALTSSQGAVRKNNGCLDTDNNNNDFTVVTAPVPRNSGSTAVFCGAAPPPSITAGTLVDFGNVTVGSNSASQNFNVSGSDLTGAPGNLTVTSPSADFQVSNNNTSWASSTTIPYTTSTLAPTPVYVRFIPQSPGAKSGNVVITGGGVATPVNVAVSGNGLPAATPVLTTSSLSPFGNTCVNSTAGPNSFVVSGSNLNTTNIVVGPLNGYTFSTTSTGTYTSSLSITQTGGTFSQTVFVKFTPTSATSFNGNIPVSGGGASSINVAASGAGANNPPTAITGGATSITTVSATLAGSITPTGCTAVTAYGIEYSTTNGFANGTGTTIAGTNLSNGNFSIIATVLTPATTYYYKAYATNGGGTAYGTQQSFTTLAPPPPVLTASTIAGFGNLCLNVAGGPNSFTLTGSNLTAAPVVVGPLAGYSFSTTSGGTYSSSLSLATSGGTLSQTVFVKLTPTANQNYSGNLPIAGGGHSGINVAVSGNGFNTPPSAVTGQASNIGTNNATVAGSVSNTGCSPITNTGISYSGRSGFAGEHGTHVSAGTSTNFSVNLNNLVQGTTYYYRAFATNAGGTFYGTEQSFTTVGISSGLIVHSSPIKSGSELHYSLKDIRPGHYQVRLYDWIGRIVFERNIIVQVNFIDERIFIPGNIKKGAYKFQVGNESWQVNKSIMIL